MNSVHVSIDGLTYLVDFTAQTQVLQRSVDAQCFFFLQTSSPRLASSTSLKTGAGSRGNLAFSSSAFFVRRQKPETKEISSEDSSDKT